MKYGIFSYRLPLILALCQVTASISANDSHRELLVEKQQLMASHLPPSLQGKLKSFRSLSYATGHAFYDTPIELIDENGHRITYREDLKKAGHYQVEKIGRTRLMQNSIWFFRPDGSTNEVSADNIWESCTAEYPCQNLSQSMVDSLPAYVDAQLWLASGHYVMPLDKRQNQLLINLKKNALIGRNSDFKFIAYGEDRPQLEGTLIWYDFSKHAGVDGQIENVRVKTADAPIQVMNGFVNVNLFGSKTLAIKNVDLEKTHQDRGQNVLAENISIMDSNLSAEGEVTRNVSADHLYLDSSNLAVKGKHTVNVHVGMGPAFIFNSKLKTAAQSCYSIAIEEKSNSDFMLQDTSISMKSDADCPQYAPPLTGLVISPNRDANYPGFGKIYLENLNLKINAQDASIVAFESHNASLNLDHVTVNLQSQKGEVYVADSFSTSELLFLNLPSYLWLKSPVVAAIQSDHSHTAIKNNSTPLSQCKFNQLASVNC